MPIVSTPSCFGAVPFRIRVLRTRPNSQATAHSWAGSRRGCIDFSLVRCTAEMQLRPRMHLLACEFANIFSSSSSFPLRFRILRQAEELKCSFENVATRNIGSLYCLWHKRYFEKIIIKQVKITYYLFYFCSKINEWVLWPEKSKSYLYLTFWKYWKCSSPKIILNIIRDFINNIL